MPFVDHMPKGSLKPKPHRKKGPNPGPGKDPRHGPQRFDPATGFPLRWPASNARSIGTRAPEQPEHRKTSPLQLTLHLSMERYAGKMALNG